MLKGRLGLETARVPHADRHGLLWLGHGQLLVKSGTLRFITAGAEELEAGSYDIPFQGVSLILLGPGCSLTHDVLRLSARHGTGLVAVGDNGVRFYSAPPKGPDHSRWARRQARMWADPALRLEVARRMYGIRLGQEPSHRTLEGMRGLEGARVREMYKQAAHRFGVSWRGRRYDRSDPGAADLPNQAMNHSSTAVGAAAELAVAATATIPQLGFIHEESARAFPLDIADLYRHTFTVPAAFQAVRNFQQNPNITLERHVRRLAGELFRKKKLIPSMIDQIKELISAYDHGANS